MNLCEREEVKNNMYLSDKSKKIMPLLIVCISVVVLFSFIGVAINKKNLEKNSNYLHDITMECIVTKDLEESMINEREGEMIISVEYPDFQELFSKAKNQVNSKQELEDFFVEKLTKHKYTAKQSQVVAKIVMESGERKVYRDEAILELLEYELINAIDSLSEGE